MTVEDSNQEPVLIHCRRPNWILGRAAKELIDRIPRVQMARGKVGKINYSIPYKACTDCSEGIHVGLYTHRQNRRKFNNMVKRQHYHVGMSEKTCALIRSAGGEDPLHIPLGTSLQSNITFGVVGRTYRSGRKGEKFVRKAVESGYTVKAWGSGWPCEIVSKDFGEIESFYRSIDYLLVTSLNEGGPMSVIEAISLGVPVIAPDVGWCWEYPVIRYERGKWDSLNSVLKRLTTVPTWENWAECHRKLFSKIDQALEQK